MLVSVALFSQVDSVISVLKPIEKKDVLLENTVSEKVLHQKDDQLFNTEYKQIVNSVVQKNIADSFEKIYFPEGFTMNLPKNTYTISKEKGKYIFQYKKTPSEFASFEVFVTDYNIQDVLASNNYFLVSKNGELALYGVYALNEKTNMREILGFRLFYTVLLDNNVYITSRSNIFKDYTLNKNYIKEVANIDPCFDILANNDNLRNR